ncbi:N-6 DNA methylase [Gordonia sp. NPDC057258]|uniref:N-6 DNA methylase n=1 Tax=unclassified Gordonia (in: high G+C Gram-positive bacteria) TaxID=2657482 RepID=UPI00362E902A
MPSPGISETETVVKRVLPYLQRRGYELDDLSFELPTAEDGSAPKFVDISVTAGGTKPKFLIEAKRQSHRLLKRDREQALDYGTTLSVPFVVLTNGAELEILNTQTREQMRVTDSRAGRTMIPHKANLTAVLKRMRTNPMSNDLNLTDKSLPFRPGLPLKQLNALFARCHSKIRQLEKDEDNAFADFSKLLFLRLLEEKEDDPVTSPGFKLPYSTRFHELADKPSANADEVKTLVDEMISRCRAQYGDVITDKLHIKKPSTYAYLVTELSKVSFTDSGLDTKGAAFEYFVRATLKGKKLGQYFTPRQLVDLMLVMVGEQLIVDSVATGEPIKVLDPACGTGGFLVFLMKHSLEEIDRRRKDRRLTKASADKLTKRVMEETFYGVDANSGVASSAKMNMIISGDGHTNIICANSLDTNNTVWSLEKAEYDLIISNPPFGTSETDLPPDQLAEYPVRTTRGQLLFLQHMLKSVVPGGTVCTVIDDGALNNNNSAETRRWIMENSRIRAVISLPSVTFAPNKISVKSSVLMFERLESVDDPEEEYEITFASLDTLGFHPSGELIRNFDTKELRDQVRNLMQGDIGDGTEQRGHIRSFPVSSHDILEDTTCRLDFKYWDPVVIKRIAELVEGGGVPISAINTIETARGISPRATQYVDAADGYAMVLKAGSSVTKFGEVVDSGDWIEKSTYDELGDRAKVQKGDVLLSSTGTGTLGKAGVYEEDTPAVADSHITIIRVDQKKIDPRYLADFLRDGFGRVQSDRLFAGSTGLVELSRENVDSIVVPNLTVKEQKRQSKRLHDAQGKAVDSVAQAESALAAARMDFAGFDLDALGLLPTADEDN